MSFKFTFFNLVKNNAINILNAKVKHYWNIIFDRLKVFTRNMLLIFLKPPPILLHTDFPWFGAKIVHSASILKSIL